MKVLLHANATTTPRVRAAIQNSTASITNLARRFGISETTVRRWRGRQTQADYSHDGGILANLLAPPRRRLLRRFAAMHVSALMT